ncbi:MAG: hypothetical protein IKG15_07440 [Solobacterium sp.]|nr:hypothetical protein [Solobacterium sp.]
MKQLTCEMCGSTNLIKQDGLFVCQACGTKYSVEEAKKMMIEGQVDVSGSTVKIDNTASVDNYFNMAESAYESNNSEEAENYCNKIIEIEPANYKAWFLKGKAAGWQSTLSNLRIEEAVNCFSKAVDYAPEEEKEEYKKNAAKETESLSSALMNVCCNNYEKLPIKENADRILKNLRLTQLYSLVLLSKCGVSADGFKKDLATKINGAVYNAWFYRITKDFDEDGHPAQWKWEKFIDQGDAALALLKEAIDLADDDDDADVIRYKNMITIQNRLVNAWFYNYSAELGGYRKQGTLNEKAKIYRIDQMMEWHGKIKEIDPTYEIPEKPKPNMSGGGCYVATAVYGSYDCPQVWTLRRYRDNILAETWYGRAFIRTYYAVSPTLVKLFGNTNWFKTIWKYKLDRMVDDLNKKGVEDTPYEDKAW